MNYFAIPGLKLRASLQTGNMEISDIAQEVSDSTGISVKLMKGKIRERDIVDARHIAMWLSKKFTRCSFKQISNWFGGRDHTTAIHAVKNVNDLLEKDEAFQMKVADVEKRLK